MGGYSVISRTFVAIYRHGTRLYILEGTVPKGAPAPGRDFAETARGARKWNDANVLALSLRTTSDALLGEILDAWFEGEPSDDDADRANIRHVDEIAQ